MTHRHFTKSRYASWMIAVCTAMVMCGIANQSFAEKIYFAGYKGGFYIRSEEEGGMELRLGGTFQTDYRYYLEDERADNRFDLRRSRLLFRGGLTRWFRFGMEFEFQGNETSNIVESFGELVLGPHALKMGQYKEPFSLEWQTRDKALFFAERSMAYSLGPQRDIGLMAHGSVAYDALNYSWGIFNGDGEADADKFLSVYPDKTGTKLDHCALCHKGGAGPKGDLGSCQYCHCQYGYDGSGNIVDTINAYGMAYYTGGRNEASIASIENLDSDGDGYSNIEEINTIRFPGDADDDPSKVPAPYRIYTREQIEAMTVHTQFMLMNTSRSGDEYAEYTGVPMKELLDDAGILDTATHIIVYSVDGWFQTHPMEYDDPDVEAYHVYGNMPVRVPNPPPLSKSNPCRKAPRTSMFWRPDGPMWTRTRL